MEFPKDGKPFRPKKYRGTAQLSELDKALFSGYDHYTMHPLRLMYRTIQGYLDHDRSALEDLVRPQGSAVALESPLAFFFIARENFSEFKHGALNMRGVEVERNRLVALIMCAIPSFSLY